MSIFRIAGLLMLGLVCSALVSSPASAQSKAAQWAEFKKEVKQDCGDFWNAHKGDLEYPTKNLFVNDQCWSGAQKASTWTYSGSSTLPMPQRGKPQLALRKITCPKSQTKIKLDYRFQDGQQAETCVTFR